MKTYWLLGERGPPSSGLPQITTTSTSSGSHDDPDPPDYASAVNPAGNSSAAAPRVRAHFEDETVTTFIDAASSTCSTPRSTTLPNGNVATLADEFCGAGANGGGHGHSVDNCSESEPLTSNGRLRHAV
jgi:hypothetical protein